MAARAQQQMSKAYIIYLSCKRREANIKTLIKTSIVFSASKRQSFGCQACALLRAKLSLSTLSSFAI